MRLGDLLDLLPLLEEADPDDIVIINAGSGSIMLINARPGLHQPIAGPPVLELNAGDERFLRSLHIPI